MATKPRGGQHTTPMPGEKRPKAPPAPPMKGNAALVCHGSIGFELLPNGEFAVRQGWNPSRLNRENRTAIAKELRSIADHMDQDQFEDGRIYRHYPLP